MWKGSQHDTQDTQSVACGLSVWYDTPWIRLKPCQGSEYRLPDDAPAVPDSMRVSALTAEQMTAHRLRGHIPYEPSCEVCQSCKGVHRHGRRKTQRGVVSEVVADFGFLNKDSEVSISETRGSYKFLALKETFSSSIGCVLITGDPQRDLLNVCKWLNEFGLKGGEVLVSLVTDAGSAVSAQVSEAGGGSHFSVKRAGPQNHETVGHAERTIRWSKESVRTLMLEFQKQGLTLAFEKVFAQRLLSCVCFSHNSFNLVQGSNKTREIAVGSKVSQDCFALFGSKVLAEVPQSILERSPNMPRFISAAFIHPEFQSSGSAVIGKIRVCHEMIIRCFVAKSLKLVLPIEIQNEFGLFTQLVDERSGLPRDSGSAPSSMESRVLPQNQDTSLTCPSMDLQKGVVHVRVWSFMALERTKFIPKTAVSDTRSGFKNRLGQVKHLFQQLGAVSC